MEFGGKGGRGVFVVGEEVDTLLVVTIRGGKGKSEMFNGE